ncbi:MAG: SemiSWEET transporter [Candidatus Omnitrophica bacterium]|nr:SemiSWEET transporter [Candidatus Omnitrophota bacterium]
MTHVKLIGTIAAICTTISFIPQVIRIYRTRHARDLSLAMYLLLSFGVFMWMCYGLLIGSEPIIVANAVTLTLCLYIILMKFRFG